MILHELAEKKKNIRHGFHGLTLYEIKLLPEGLGCWENLLYEILTTDKRKNKPCNLCVAASDPCQKKSKTV